MAVPAARFAEGRHLRTSRWAPETAAVTVLAFPATLKRCAAIKLFSF
jgi:hypothetical protein